MNSMVHMSNYMKIKSINFAGFVRHNTNATGIHTDMHSYILSKAPINKTSGDNIGTLVLDHGTKLNPIVFAPFHSIYCQSECNRNNGEELSCLQQQIGNTYKHTSSSHSHYYKLDDAIDSQEH